MAAELEGAEFVQRKVRDAVVLGPARLVSCAFSGCRITCTDFDRRAMVQRVEARRCTVTSSGLRGAIFTECVFDDLRTSGGLFQAWSCLYDRVTLTGRFDRLMLAPLRFPESREFDARLAREQAEVEWALDIAHAEVRELDIRGVPAELIRRDEETQALVFAERARDTDYASVASGVARITIDLMLEHGEDSCIIVAPKRHRTNFSKVMAELERLRAAGIAE